MELVGRRIAVSNRERKHMRAILEGTTRTQRRRIDTPKAGPVLEESRGGLRGRGTNGKTRAPRATHSIGGLQHSALWMRDKECVGRGRLRVGGREGTRGIRTDRPGRRADTLALVGEHRRGDDEQERRGHLQHLRVVHDDRPLRNTSRIRTGRERDSAVNVHEDNSPKWWIRKNLRIARP